MRVQAEPSAPHTMEDIAKRYLDMMQKGLKMAGTQKTPYESSKLHLDNIRYYQFKEEENSTKEMPFCIEEPKETEFSFRPYKDLKAISEEDRNKPACWYDARFFYELNKAMVKVAFLDEEITLPEVRSEYLKLMQHIHKTS